MERTFLAPAHPCMGWVSNNRYWHELLAQSAGDAGVVSLLRPGPVETPRVAAWRRYLIRQVVYPLRVRRVRSGVLHVLDQSFAHLLRFARPGVGTVVTVHDVIPLLDREGLNDSQARRYRRIVGTLTRADRVSCSSEHTRRDVERLLGVEPARMTVNPVGTSRLPAPDGRWLEELGERPGYLLSVGNTAPRKNLGFFPPMLSALAEKGLRLRVVRIGEALPGELAEGIRRHAELLELGRAPDAQLAAAYAHAGVVVMPSTYEGFGLPVVEAMAAGCPVLCSRTTSLGEVAGDGALTFDPGDPKEAADLCLRLYREEGLRQAMVARGRARAAAFTYEAHWARLKGLYEEASEMAEGARRAEA